MPQKIIDIDPSKPIASTVAELQFQPRPVILLLSDFDNQLDAQVRSICSRVIVPAALDPGALIVDNARCSGCAASIAQAALDQDKMVPLLGIVPNNRPSSDIDTDHELVLRLPSAWTDLAKYTCQIVSELIQNGNDPKPAIAVLFGGADLEKRAVIRCAARRWPVLVIKGTGGLADQILTARSAQSDGANTSTVTDPDLREILETATIYPSSIDAAIDDLNRILLGRLDRRPGTVDATLEQAWHQFDLLDLTAVEKQTRFRLLEMALITLAVLAALFAILTTTSSRVPPSFRTWAHAHYIPAGSLHWLVLLTPIAISVIGAYNSHFRDGNKWILLRGAAEALKREIFRFRAQAGIYSEEQCLETSRELKLAAKLKDITSALEQSEVNKTNLLSPPKIDVTKLLPQHQPKEAQRARMRAPSQEEEPAVLGGTRLIPRPFCAASLTDRNSFLNPNDYIAQRLRDQIAHFIKKTGELARKLRLLQCAIYIVGAAGTLLAAIGFDVWVALATAGVTALTTKLQTDQIENSLMQYNQALAGLRNIDVWWTALSSWEKRRRNNIDVLVDQTEKTLESELAGWVQQMQSGLDKLTEKEPQKG